MRLIGFAAAGTVLAGLSACSPGAANNSAGNGANVAAEEGIEDINSAVSGDELSLVPEAEDDLAGNGGAAPSNLTENAARPR